ncbi:type II secretion system protein PilB [Acidocella aminolytica 101 = DSM 11237]|uniref:GspE/PulE family protein n=1 Tax=Acidocella aminolytica TaxID=33998 RepID=UPI002156713E|nr:ATPase, T2SS/T4P/T4SS family [Acidocella aminolytica]GBQ33668.1 type II secretion system protein PilB [Acidocella aminolytica 101 = DSM 11237]
MDGDARIGRDLPALPDHLSEFIAIDSATLKLYVEPRRKADPLLLTWLDRCRQRGVKFDVVALDLDEIVEWRRNGLRPVVRSTTSGNDAALENREAAMNILARGASYTASDIHILLRGSHTEVQFRVKGELRVAERLTQEEGEAIIRAFYQGIAVVKDASFTPLETQNAQISGPIVQEYGPSSVRIVRGPAHPVEAGGGFMVLRLQYMDTAAARKQGVGRTILDYPRRPDGTLRLEEMGYLAKQADKLRYLIEGSSGIVLFTGPTGSGKTTSIYELLRESARLSPMLRLVSIEKPVEYPMPWAVQLSITGDGVGDDEGDAFGDYLRHSLRMDPDWIFLGEIRSAGVALTAFEASLTGHKVVSTIHTEDPFSVPDRIEIMDAARLPRQMFCNSKMIRGIVNQRLVPQLCPHCAVPLSAARSDALWPRLSAALDTYAAAWPQYGDLSRVRLRGAGCAACHHDGISRRIAIAEVIVTDADLMRDFVDHGADTARRNYRKRADADWSVLHTAMDGVMAGRIDPRDVGRYVDVVVSAERVDE